MKKLNIRIREVDNGYIVWEYRRIEPGEYLGTEPKGAEHVARTIAELKTLIGALALEAQVPEFKKPREEG